MKYFNFKLFFFLIIFQICFISIGKSQTIKEIEIIGNERISKETIIMFSTVSIPENITQNKLNTILKELYKTNYFKDVNVKLSKEKIIITVSENPIIENINFEGIKSKTLKEKALKNTKLKSRSSYNEFLIKDDKDSIISSLKNLGYYQSKVDVFVEELSNNKVNIDFKINIGSKAKIKKITFVGNKIFKDSKLKNIILSEEYKFWKFISGKKYLNQNIVDFDLRLLKNY